MWVFDGNAEEVGNAGRGSVLGLVQGLSRMDEKRDISGGVDCNADSNTSSLRGLEQVCRIQMIVKVPNEMFDEPSVLWTRGENNRVDERDEKAKK
jgi:hypothetical protein